MERRVSREISEDRLALAAVVHAITITTRSATVPKTAGAMTKPKVYAYASFTPFPVVLRSRRVFLRLVDSAFVESGRSKGCGGVAESGAAVGVAFKCSVDGRV